MDIDHIVIWVSDPKRAIDFYAGVLGFDPVRVDDYNAGKAPFPSVRVNDRTIIDIMDKNVSLAGVRRFTGGGDDAGGHPLNHLCFSMNKDDYAALSSRLAGRGIEVKDGGGKAFGARGQAVRSVYFSDPDGNVLEMRYYGH